MLFLKKLKIVLQSNIFYYLCFIFLIFYLFIITIVIKYDTKIDNLSVLEGIVIDINIKDNKISFILKNSEKIKCTYYLKDNESIDSLLGKKVKISGEKSKFYNNTIPNTFNYKKYLYNNKIYVAYTVKSIEILNDENIFYKIKNKITRRINSFDDLTRKYLNLFILGDKSYLSDESYNTYKTNGIWHLFAISGMHIGLITLILDKILFNIKFKKSIISSILMYFMFLTNFSASVMRATIFYFLKNLLHKLNCSLDNKKILFLTAFIILILNPFMIYNTGFQYSFLVTYIIMLMSNKITGNYFIKIFKISFISFIVSMPITINLNFEINLLSIFLNILFVPFISLIIFPLSVITFFIPLFGHLLNILILILEFLNNLLYNLKLNIVIPKIPIFLIIIYYLILYLFYKCNNKKYLFFYILILFINYMLPKIDNNYYVYYLDVGQGDSSVLISPYKNEVIMIDTGGSINSNYHVSNNVMLFLKSIGIAKINLLIISHGDYDHMGESINLVNNFKVEKVIFNCGSYNNLEKELIKVLDNKKIEYYSCINELNLDSNKLYFLNTREYDNENDNSNIIYTELNNYKFLLMGDASSVTEKEILNKYNLTNIDVLKVGHHGSKTSSSEEFINTIKPKYSLISVGKNNRYGHPNNEVLDNLNDSKIYRTDINGSIMFKIKNNNLKIETCPP